MNIYVLSLGMMLVTYLPRLIPMLLMNPNRLPRKLSHFFSAIPFAAMGALIIPSGLYAVEDNLLASVAGLAAAAVSAWLLKSIVAAVLISIAVVFLVLTVL